MSAPGGSHSRLAGGRERIERYLDKELPAAPTPPERLHEAMRYAVFAGGKRLRPLLAFAAAEALGQAPQRVLPVAAAVELVHCYSLVHDDLPAMDDDAERRGQPSVYVRFDEATAILAGDALLAEAFALLAREGAPAAVLGRLGEAAGSRGLVGGQVDDLASECGTPDLERVLSVHLRKTAALFRFALWGAGRSLGAPPAALQALDRFGRHYGLAFQAADDLAEPERAECSLLQVRSPEWAREQVREELERALTVIELFGERADALRELGENLASRVK